MANCRPQPHPTWLIALSRVDRFTNRVPETVRIACCQLQPDVENPSESAARARAALSDAVTAGAQIVILPELCPCGYVFKTADEVRAIAEPAGGDLLKGWAQEAAKGDAVVIGGFCELADDGRVFNSAALVDGDGVQMVYRKLHLWNEEAIWFLRGERPAPVVQTRYGRIGMGICYDIEFPEFTRGLALAGADLIAFPTNWPVHQWPLVEETPILRSIALTSAYHSHVFLAVCDRAGVERGVRFRGGSVITAPDGAVLAEVGEGAEVATIFADVDLIAARDKRTGPRNDAFADRRPEHYLANLSHGGQR